MSSSAQMPPTILPTSAGVETPPLEPPLVRADAEVMGSLINCLLMVPEPEAAVGEVASGGDVGGGLLGEDEGGGFLGGDGLGIGGDMLGVGLGDGGGGDGGGGGGGEGGGCGDGGGGEGGGDELGGGGEGGAHTAHPWQLAHWHLADQSPFS